MNENSGGAGGAAHDISVRSRKKMSITGVSEVLSFDESAVHLQTVCGELTVEGESLRIGTLDTERGLVALEGASIDGLFYLRPEGEERRGLLGRWHKG